MAIEDQLIQVTKETLVDLVNLRYEKLKNEDKLNDEIEEFLNEVIPMQGVLTLPPSDEDMDIDVYEYNDNSGFGTEIRYLWFDDEESQLVLFCEAKTDTEKSKLTEFYIDTIDA
ncbi:hypothetical protein FJQ98_11815 [Lysinibacillus agricola]|uniref:DUF7668 domain-containing protein n=1 Tax=Lysinibacillus agricola TaxID=2590012 RepID=A0ABX7AXB9_9BACI|nr:MULTISPECIES: hypothetical protein [Lysinibacillus]KOS60327.1 hypothetical protein AN161_24925 [Lysinibacillus sp. FJAT-14222]QQP14623.1 hypothetical protein FJQ98_11815 [Lysinibacillus agricola]